MRAICRALLLLLILGLPFEYFFASREQSLYSSLKLQMALFLLCWGTLKIAGFLRNGSSTLRSLTGALSPWILPSLVLFAAVQLAAAAAAPEYLENAAKSAAKSALAVIVVLAAADLTCDSSGFPRREFRSRYLATLALTGLAVSIVGLGEVAGIDAISRSTRFFQPRRFFEGPYLRLSSTMEYPNTAANLLTACLMACLALSVTGRSDKNLSRNTAWSAAAAVTGAALLWTQSLGALGSALLGIASASWMFWKSGTGGRLPLLYWSGAVALAGILAFGTLAVSRPAERHAAEYSGVAAEEVRHLEQARSYKEVLTVRNTSSGRWSRGEFGIAYRWHSLDSGETSPPQEAAHFTADLDAGQERAEPVVFETPNKSGEHLLIWFVFRTNGGLQVIERSYSPAVLTAVSPSGEDPPPLSARAVRLLETIREERSDRAPDPPPRRLELWKAAARMANDRPWLGMGPDNFRLLKSRYMDGPKGDATILANSLWFEVLAGSGVLGLAAAIWLLWRSGRTVLQYLRPGEPGFGWFGVAWFASFLGHGTVDYFLKFTPTYLLFWITLGVVCARRPAGEHEDAHRL